MGVLIEGESTVVVETFLWRMGHDDPKRCDTLTWHATDGARSSERRG